MLLISLYFICHRRQPQKLLGDGINLFDPGASNLPGLLARLDDAAVSQLKLCHCSMGGFAQRRQLLVIEILLVEL